MTVKTTRKTHDPYIIVKVWRWWVHHGRGDVKEACSFLAAAVYSGDGGVHGRSVMHYGRSFILCNIRCGSYRVC
jgi:hypothetical protein